MALPQFRQWVLVNNSGQTITWTANGRINIKETAIHFDTTNGKIVYTQLTDDDLGFVSGQSNTNGSERVGDNEVDNTSNLYVMSHVQIEITHDEGGAADGTFDLYMAAGDVTGELETDASGYDDAETNKLRYVGSLVWHASGVDDEIMRSPVFTIG